jgi:[ribosomal protein S5]-alanine N-acetyltransferase
MQIPDNPIIETPRLILRLLQQRDLGPLLDVNGDDEVTRFLPYASWQGMADATAWYERAMTRHTAGESWQFVIALRETDRAVGTALLFHFVESSARAEIGYALGKAQWQQGYMSEAMNAFVAYAFEQAGMRRLEAEIDPLNTGSAKLLERIGFAQEGIRRERWTEKGRVSDSALYGLLRSEWTR